MSAPQPTPGPWRVHKSIDPAWEKFGVVGPTETVWCADRESAIETCDMLNSASATLLAERDALSAECERLRAERDALRAACESARIALTTGSPTWTNTALTDLLAALNQ